VCLIVCGLETSKPGGLDPIWAVAPQKKKEKTYQLIQYKATQLMLRLRNQKSRFRKHTRCSEKDGTEPPEIWHGQNLHNLGSGFVGLH
jgi:hypothetical protein